MLFAAQANSRALERVTPHIPRDIPRERLSQQADIALEHRELQEDARGELRELAGIYVKRGLDRDLAMKVAEQLSAKDRLGAHLRDELGIAGTNMARPLQAAGASALSFAVSGLLPILALLAAPAAWRIPVVACVSLACLAVLGALGGRLGGAAQGRAAIRVVLGGTLAMAVTAAVGRLFGVSAG